MEAEADDSDQREGMGSVLAVNGMVGAGCVVASVVRSVVLQSSLALLVLLVAPVLVAPLVVGGAAFAVSRCAATRGIVLRELKYVALNAGLVFAALRSVAARVGHAEDESRGGLQYRCRMMECAQYRSCTGSNAGV